MSTMSSVRMFCIMVAFIIMPLNEARSAGRGDDPFHRPPLKKLTSGPDTTMTTGPETTPLMTTPAESTSAESQPPPTSTTNSTTPPTASSSTTTTRSTNAFSPPSTTTTRSTNAFSPPLTSTTRSTDAFSPPATTTAKSTITSISRPNTLAATSIPTSSATTSTEFPAIFADAEPAYNDVYTPYNTNDQSVAPTSANSQKVLVKQQPITLMKLLPLMMSPNGYSGTNQQGSQVQPYMVLEQAPAYRMDYYHIAPMVGNNPGMSQSPLLPPQPPMMADQPSPPYQQGPKSQVELLEPYMMMNQAPPPPPPMYQQGSQPYMFVDQAPSAYQQGSQLPEQPYMIIDQAPPAYAQGSQFQQLPYMIVDQAPSAYPQESQPYMVVNQVPGGGMNYYNSAPGQGSYSEADQGFQQSPNMVMQQPYAEDIKLSVPSPMPHNLTLSKPDVLLVKKDMGNNNVKPKI